MGEAPMGLAAWAGWGGWYPKAGCALDGVRLLLACFAAGWGAAFLVASLTRLLASSAAGYSVGRRSRYFCAVAS